MQIGKQSFESTLTFRRQTIDRPVPEVGELINNNTVRKRPEQSKAREVSKRFAVPNRWTNVSNNKSSSKSKADSMTEKQIFEHLTKADKKGIRQRNKSQIRSASWNYLPRKEKKTTTETAETRDEARCRVDFSPGLSWVKKEDEEEEGRYDGWR